MSQGTSEEIGISEKAFIIRNGYWYKWGEFSITSFDTVHDCMEPRGYIISHPDMGKMLFVTDSAYVVQNFKKLSLNHILIECNYSEQILNDRLVKNEIDSSLSSRIIKTHMGLNTCKEFIKANKTSSLDSVTLLHLSDGNSNAVEFQQAIQEVVGNDVRVAIADKGVKVKLDLFPW